MYLRHLLCVYHVCIKGYEGGGMGHEKHDTI